MYCKDCGVELTENAKFCHRCGAPVWRGETLPADESQPRRSEESFAQQIGANQSQGLYPSLGPIQAQSIYPPQQLQRRGRRPGVTLALSFLVFVGVFVFQVIGYLIGNLFGDTGELSATLGSAVGAACGMAVLGGANLMRLDAKAIVLSFKKGWWVILVSAALCVFGLIESFVIEHGTLTQDWPMRMLWLCALCASIGFSEEGMFRGILLGGVLDVCGKNRREIMMAAGISALLFGVAHLEWWSINWLDPLQALQAVLKMLQTGTLGFFLAALVIRGKNVWGVAIIHGLDDFLIMIPSIGLLGQSAEVSYVNAGDAAIATIVLYAIVIAVYMPLVISGVKMLKEVPAPDQGPFHKEAQ